jgi:hypothetical protein
MSPIKVLKSLIKLSYKSNPFHLFSLYINKRQLTNALTSLMLVVVVLILVSHFLVSIVEAILVLQPHAIGRPKDAMKLEEWSLVGT